MDEITGKNAGMGADTSSYASTATWTPDTTLGTVFDTNQPGVGSNAWIYTPNGTMLSSDTKPSISIWFKTTHTDTVLVSLQSSLLSGGGTTSGNYDPVLYVGSDGLLNGQWWNGTSRTVLTSTKIVDDGQWHHAVLAGNNTTQTLTLDGATQGNALTGQINLNPTGGGLPYLDFGAGYIGGGWPDESHQNQSGGTGYRTFFNGQIADIAIAS